MIILIHSSKTMRPIGTAGDLPQPALIEKTERLATYLQTLSVSEIADTMRVSPKLAASVHDTFRHWHAEGQRPAIDSFLGDIYSGLQVASLTTADRLYADNHLRILSGLYGILRPSDGIQPYRLEMGYRLPDDRFKNLYEFWGADIVSTLPATGPIINLAANEYSKVLGNTAARRLITPRFLTISPKTGQPTFIVVHAKIARGAFAHWLIRQRVEKSTHVKDFRALGYHHEPSLSSPTEPVYVCRSFGGLGLSVRLS